MSKRPKVDSAPAPRVAATTTAKAKDGAGKAGEKSKTQKKHKKRRRRYENNKQLGAKRCLKAYPILNSSCK